MPVQVGTAEEFLKQARLGPARDRVRAAVTAVRIPMERMSYAVRSRNAAAFKRAAADFEESWLILEAAWSDYDAAVLAEWRADLEVAQEADQQIRELESDKARAIQTALHYHRVAEGYRLTDVMPHPVLLPVSLVLIGGFVAMAFVFAYWL